MLAVALALQVTLQPLDNHVNDYAGVLSTSERNALRSRAASVLARDGVAIVIVVVKSLDEIGAGTVNNVATSLFNAWGIGDQRSNRGILVLLAIESRDLRIELGAGWGSGASSGAEQAADAMTPHFRDGRYGAGLLAGVGELDALAGGRTSAVEWGKPPPAGALLLLPVIIIGALVLVIALRAVWGGGTHRGYRTHRRRSWFMGGGWGRSSYGRSSFGSSSFGRSSFGGGFSRGGGVSRKW